MSGKQGSVEEEIVVVEEGVVVDTLSEPEVKDS